MNLSVFQGSGFARKRYIGGVEAGNKKNEMNTWRYRKEESMIMANSETQIFADLLCISSGNERRYVDE
jgi:hypothetical protein